MWEQAAAPTGGYQSEINVVQMPLATVVSRAVLGVVLTAGAALLLPISLNLRLELGLSAAIMVPITLLTGLARSARDGSGTLTQIPSEAARMLADAGLVVDPELGGDEEFFARDAAVVRWCGLGNTAGPSRGLRLS